MFLITGAGRSGTKYITKVLRRCGLDVKHERMGQGGIVSGFYCFDADQYPGDNHPVPRPDFDIILHQVRHPLKTIASVQTGRSRGWAQKFVPVEPGASALCWACHYWLTFNLEAELQASFTYRIEALGEAWPEIQRLLGFKRSYEFATAGISKRTHSRDHAEVTWSQVRSVAPVAYHSIRSAARRYGYE